MTPRKIIIYCEKQSPAAPYWVAYYEGDEKDRSAHRGIGMTEKEAFDNFYKQIEAE